jgi:hypothetical protein
MTNSQVQKYFSITALFATLHLNAGDGDDFRIDLFCTLPQQLLLI